MASVKSSTRRRPSPLAWIVVAVVLSALPLSAALSNATRPEDVGLSSERLQRINQMVQRYIDAKEITGAVTIVSRKGKIAHFEAQGLMDVENKTPMRKDAIFRMASMSKPVTGVAILMLVEEGKMRLTDPVSRFIPGFKNLQVAMPKPTTPGAGGGGTRPRPRRRGAGTGDLHRARDSRNHRSRSADAHLGPREQRRRQSRRRSAPRRGSRPTRSRPTSRSSAAGPLDFQPGTVWQYSLLAGMETLGRIVEIASGQTYEQFLKQRLFDPLGMKDTFFWVPADKQSRVVTLYNQRPNGLERTGTPEWLDTKIASGGGGLYSTAEDYIQFAQMLANGGELNGKRILSPRTVDQMAVESRRRSVREDGTGGKGHGLRPERARRGGSRRGEFGARQRQLRLVGRVRHALLGRSEGSTRGVLMIQEPVNAMRGDFENAVMQAIVE